jgi:GNAT superfamily N-acetyltransferase
MIEITRITSAQTRAVRRAILRPHQPPETSVYPLDEHPDAFHAGAFDGGVLVGVASIFHEEMDGTTGRGVWRVRGMAVEPARRRHGLGHRLLELCLAHARAAGARSVWCNARTTAVRFYQAHGFVIEGEEFDLPPIGPHYNMRCGL